MKIIQALPRRMKFEAKAASSVELCVSEWVSGSRYRGSTTVFAERSDASPLLDVDIFRLTPAPRLASWHLALSIRQQVKAKGYDLIVTQQHISTAARIAAFNRGTPVVLQTHNYIDPPLKGRFALVRNQIRAMELNSLGGITFVSNATLEAFGRDWPQVGVPRTVITNGFDFSTWNPNREKQKLVAVVGRANNNKGILESAQGVRDFVRAFPDWKAVFILSEINLYKDYVAEVRRTLGEVPDNVQILQNIPFAVVKDLMETAAIAVVASKWNEPFGRTALEAHAAGAALISSGTGGLREISGDCAIYLDAVTGPAIDQALRHLAGDAELRRRLVDEGGQRVRALFSLVPSDRGTSQVAPLCERLDRFYDRVVRLTPAGDLLEKAV